MTDADRALIHSVAADVIGNGDPAVAYRVSAAWPELGQSVPIERMLATSVAESPAAQQRCDGGWGRFHSADSRVPRAPVATTESAVRRALALGFTDSDRLLKRTVGYLHNLLNKNVFPDPAESNDRWPIGTRLFVGATLASITPVDPALDELRSRWRGVVTASFADGSLDRAAERVALQQVFGLLDAPRYLGIANRYLLQLLAEDRELQSDVAARLITHLCGPDATIGYLGCGLDPPDRDPGADVVHRWLCAWELVARFRSPPHAPVRRTIAWLTDSCHASPAGWDFGRLSAKPEMPLTSWRRRDQRRLDWSGRVLVLLRRLEALAMT